MKETLGLFLVVAVLLGLCSLYENYANSPERQLGPPAYVEGPNAGSDECQKLRQQLDALLDQSVSADDRAEKRSDAEYDRIAHSQTTSAQKQMALNNLSAKDDISQTARDTRFKNEEIRLREQLRLAGCQQPNK